MIHKTNSDQNGSAHAVALCVITTLIVVGVIAYRVFPALMHKTTEDTTASTPTIEPPATFHTPIQIKGDAACESSTLDALKLLSNKAPVHYATVIKYIGIIECAPQGSGMFAAEDPPRFLAGDSTRNADTAWYASGIAHEAGHSKLYHDYKDTHPGQLVPPDAWSGESAEKICLDAQYDALAKVGGAQYQLDYVKNVINTKYYEVPYGQRWW